MGIIDELLVWRDELARTGPENMAVDELLLTHIGNRPLLRFYQWSRAEVSFGYFEGKANALDAFSGEGLHYVRRWTGGGIVDHRRDLTYTLIFPRNHPIARMRGAGSYQLIHRAVAEAYRRCGMSCQLIAEDSGNGIAACFENPVAFDILADSGEKLAGAGQKRSRYGLLHQGSVQRVGGRQLWQDELTRVLADKVVTYLPDGELFVAANELAQLKYASDDWLDKRP